MAPATGEAEGVLDHLDSGVAPFVISGNLLRQQVEMANQVCTHTRRFAHVRLHDYIDLLGVLIKPLHHHDVQNVATIKLSDPLRLRVGNGCLSDSSCCGWFLNVESQEPTLSMHGHDQSWK